MNVDYASLDYIEMFPAVRLLKCATELVVRWVLPSQDVHIISYEHITGLDGNFLLNVLIFGVTFYLVEQRPCGLRHAQTRNCGMSEEIQCS